jgi:molybdate/tungstate transport system substrate-binding protein
VMWQNATSMRPLALKLVVAGIAAVALVAGGAAGWYLHTPSSSSGSATLSIIAAGSLAPSGLLPALAAAFVAQTPGVQSPVSAQLYQGSTADATQLGGGHQPFDTFVAADYRVIPEMMEAPTANLATWEVVFAGDPLVLAYVPTDSAFSGVTSTNWYEDIVKAGVTLGMPNASTDPVGVDAILALELEDNLEGLGGSLYSHFFTGAMGALAGITSSVDYIVENDAATALGADEVQAYFVYQSYAHAEGLTYVPLSSAVNLAGTTSGDVAGYGTVSTKVVTGPTSTSTVYGAPILFALTVPASAPDAALGIAFAAFLISNATSATWASDGFSPIAPAYVDHPSAIPAALSGTAPGGLAVLPSYLAALITT